MVYLVLYTVCYRLELGVSRGLGSVWEDGSGLFSLLYSILQVGAGSVLRIGVRSGRRWWFI